MLLTKENIKQFHDDFVAKLMTDPKFKVSAEDAASKRKQAHYSKYHQHWETDGPLEDDFMESHARQHPNVQTYLLMLKTLKKLENK